MGVIIPDKVARFLWPTVYNTASPLVYSDMG